MADLAPRRALGLLDATLLVSGNIIGGAIFLVGGVVAAHVASPASLLGVWVAGGMFALAGAISNGELGAAFPRVGGEYVYLREAYGPRLGFLSGWTALFVGFPGSIATMSAGFAHAVAVLAGVTSRAFELGVAASVVVALTALNVRGVRAGKWTQNVLSLLQLAAFSLFVVLAFVFGHGGASTEAPFFRGGDRPSELALALVPVAFAYSGWNAATYVAGEIRDARRTLGRALALGTIVCIVLYVAVHVVYLRVLSLDEMRAAPMVAGAAFSRLFGAPASRLLTALVALSILTSLQATVLVGPRIHQAMAEDGLFFRAFARTSRGGAPVRAVVVQGVLACALLATGTFERLLTFTTVAIVLFSTLTVAGVLVLRVRRPELPRAFRAPSWVPVFFVVGNAWVLWNVIVTGAREALLGLIVVATGLPAFEAFRRRAIHAHPSSP